MNTGASDKESTSSGSEEVWHFLKTLWCQTSEKLNFSGCPKCCCGERAGWFDAVYCFRLGINRGNSTARDPNFLFLRWCWSQARKRVGKEQGGQAPKAAVLISWHWHVWFRGWWNCQTRRQCVLAWLSVPEETWSVSGRNEDAGTVRRVHRWS